MLLSEWRLEQYCVIGVESAYQPERTKHGALFAVMVQILLSITSVAVQFVSEPEICQGAEFELRVDARVRVQRPLRICLECRSKSKNRDKSTYLYCPC